VNSFFTTIFSRQKANRKTRQEHEDFPFFFVCFAFLAVKNDNGKKLPWVWGKP